MDNTERVKRIARIVRHNTGIQGVERFALDEINRNPDRSDDEIVLVVERAFQC